MDNLVKKGSKTAKDGFKNEDEVINRFNNWKNDSLARDWLKEMNYDLNQIEYVKAFKIKGSFKADIQVQINIEIKLKKLFDVQNLQVKLASNFVGFNQIDKRWVDKYVELWNISSEVATILKYFTGELMPYVENSKDARRMFMNEFTEYEQGIVIDFIKANQSLIVSDILKGRGKFSAEWMLVILKLKTGEIIWSLKPMNFCLNLFGNGEVKITKQGSIKIGNITMQRKGGDAGRKTAQMLQFKANICLLFLKDNLCKS
jgi:hypothetical protein